MRIRAPFDLLKRHLESEAVRLALLGVRLGLLFPVGGTLLESWLVHQRIDLASCLAVQMGTPLLWIIDTVPLILGLLAGCAGRRVDLLEHEVARRTHAGQELTESKARRMGTIFKESVNEIYLFDASSLRFIQVNRAALKNLGFSMKEMRGKTPLDIKPEFEEGEFLGLIDPLRRGRQKKLVFETLHQRKDESTYPVEVHLQLLDHERGQSFIAIILDISERRAAEDALRKTMEAAEAANRAKSDFVSHISHEIRTPLSGVIGALELLDFENLLAQEKELAEIALGSARVLLGLIEEILDLAKIEADKVELDRASFDLGHLVEGLRSVLHSRFAESEIELRIIADEEMPRHIEGDPTRLRQVLINLLSNAEMFTDSGAVSLRLQKTAEDDEGVHVEFSVEDTGTGLAPEDIKRIFRPFEQVTDPGRNRGGTGLGLTICSKLIRLMGGELAVESELGTGSRFFFTLRLPWADGPGSNEETPTTRSESHLGARVLLAEDDPVNQLVAVRFLESAGCEVVAARDGEEALDHLCREAFDIVFMDRRMPRLDGLETTRRIRELEKSTGRRVPIVALSANVEAESRAECLEAGMDAFLSKPVDQARLASLLGQFLGGDATSTTRSTPVS